MSKTMQLIIIIVICCAALPAAAFSGGVITRTTDRQTVSFAQMMAAAEKSDIILVAETHDNKKHHEIQLDIIRSLRGKALPLAIGVEMFPASQQKQLDDWIEGSLTEQGFKAVFSRNWSYDWSLYRDIFLFARDNRIPLIALNVPKEIISKVARQGFDALTPEERKNLPAGVTSDLNKSQTDFLKKTFQEVFKHDAQGKVFAYFCEAQAVRNSVMAILIANARKTHPQRKIVALTGTWHAVKHGIPERLASDGSYTVILQEIYELNALNTTPAMADYMIGW